MTGDRQSRRGLSAAVCVWSSSAAGSAPAHARSPTACAGVPGAPRCHQTPRFEVRELGEIDMVSMALATLDLVAHDDARPAFPAVYLEGHTVLSCGELAGLAGESGGVLRHDSKALVLCAGDRDLATLLAYLAALRLGHADRLVAAIGTGLLEPPDTGTGSWWDEPRRQPGAWPASCPADQR
jgi:hypothetical protein